jgi:uncharacterized membrane protein
VVSEFEPYRYYILILTLVSFSVFAGGAPETEEELAALDVWHAAKLRGVAFRAVGQEPGWLLEMTTGDKIVLVTDTGQTITEYPYVEPEVFQTQRKSIFSVKPGELMVTIEGIKCNDTMSGEKFEVSVFIVLNGKQLNGCGRALY